MLRQTGQRARKVESSCAVMDARCCITVKGCVFVLDLFKVPISVSVCVNNYEFTKDIQITPDQKEGLEIEL